ncbi:MAG TPA: Clp protease N-terminal domain-containing protein [Trebonia sp.]|nr:Clp protease N-terminal domain-containing protein [Trebonia sp.]
MLGSTYVAGEGRSRSWLRRVSAALGRSAEGDLPGEGGEQSVLSATPAADITLTTAAQLAGGDPVGSHHLLLAALTDANSAAARVLASLGVDLTRAKDALHNADITGTTDELPEDAGRRQMNIKVSDEIVTIVLTDEILVQSANAALKALKEHPGAGTAGLQEPGQPGTAGQATAEEAAGGQEGITTAGSVIRGADLSGLPAVSLAKAWAGLHDALSAITSGVETAAQAETAKAAATRAKASQQAEPGSEPSPESKPGPGSDAEAAAE